MERSIEVFDTATMRHLDTQAFGIYRGSLTWLDRHDGAWWAAFANDDGHDLPEAYVMNVPEAGGELEWVATASLPQIEGQGIAWDDAGSRSTPWGISRQNSHITSFTIPVGEISDPTTAQWGVRGPAEFEE